MSNLERFIITKNLDESIEDIVINDPGWKYYQFSFLELMEKDKEYLEFIHSNVPLPEEVYLFLGDLLEESQFGV